MTAAEYWQIVDARSVPAGPPAGPLVQGARDYWAARDKEGR